MNEAPLRQHKRPLWLASILAWLAVPAGYALLFLLTEFKHRGMDGLAYSYSMISLILGLGLPVAGAAMFLVGLPLVLVFRKRGWLRALPVCLAAGVVGALAFSLFFVWMGDGAFSRGTPLLGAALGAASGAVFCLTAGIRWGSRHP